MPNIEADYQQAMADQSEKTADLKLAVQIMAGLLATGHYTENRECVDGEPEPAVRMWDAGDDWPKNTAAPRRFNCHAVDDALYLLRLLKEASND